MGIVVYIKKPDALYTQGGLKSCVVSSSTSCRVKGLLRLSCLVDAYSRTRGLKSCAVLSGLLNGPSPGMF